MVVTFTATEILVYKNSVLEETHSISNVVAGGERAFQMLGASVSSANVVYRYFNGYIKNLRFYNYAIQSTEVSALYTMYNTGMNDTAPQILSVSLTTTDTLTNNEFPKAVINMEMDVTYDSVATISSIDTQSFIIDKSNFDTSFGYVFDFRQLSDTKVAFKFGASTTIYNSQLFLKQDTITRNINSSLNVVSNPESNVLLEIQVGAFDDPEHKIQYWNYRFIQIKMSFDSSYLFGRSVQFQKAVYYRYKL